MIYHERNFGLFFIHLLLFKLAPSVLSGSTLRLKGGSTWSETSAVRKLREIAKSPYDLTALNALTPERIAKYQVCPHPRCVCVLHKFEILLRNEMC